MPPFPLTLQLGMKRFHGHVFLAPGKIYFVCGAKGGAWAAAIGQGVGGLIGGAIAGAAGRTAGDAPDGLTEAQVAEAVARNEGSLIMEAAKIEEIKHTMWWRLIRWDGKKFGLPQGMTKPLKAAIAGWAQAHNVKTKGLG